jgi:competence protein ComEA
MNHNIIQSAMLAAALLFAANLSVAATDKASAAGEAKPASKVTAADKDAATKKAKPAPKAKLVDINSASKAELKKLPGIKDADADKIIAGRPYLSKANLTTQNIVSPETYDAIKSKVVAQPNEATEAKLKEKQKAR